MCVELKAIAKNFIPAKDLDDLTQEVFEQLLNMEPNKLEALINTGDIYKYFNRMCKLNYYSRNSKYYYTYGKVNEHISFNEDFTDDLQKDKSQKPDNIYITDDSDLINSILDELYWYYRDLFKLYVLGDSENDSYSYSSLAKKTGISRTSIYYTIKSVKKYIRKRLNELRDDI